MCLISVDGGHDFSSFTGAFDDGSPTRIALLAIFRLMVQAAIEGQYGAENWLGVIASV